MVKIISIANRKGGVGKTTTAVNIATAMAAIGKRVLMQQPLWELIKINVCFQHTI